MLKGTGPEIYILQDDQLRWISSMDVFDHLGLTWADVHVVDDPELGLDVDSPGHLEICRRALASGPPAS